jgi:hypothetical protein
MSTIMIVLGAVTLAVYGLALGLQALCYAATIHKGKNT